MTEMSADTPPEEKTPPTPEELVDRLCRLLSVEEIDTDLHRGMRLPGGRGRVFGGQVIAQGLMAATRSIDDDKVAHSLHAYFMRPGDENYPIVYRVVRDFEGRSFATRRVIALQRGKPILNMAASFQTREDGLHHQAPLPAVPPPEVLTSEQEHFRRNIEQVPEPMRPFFLRPRPIEIRPVHPRSLLSPASARDPVSHSWFRAVAPVGDDATMHRAILAYASDMILLGTCMLPHGVNFTTPGLQTASLDHALWIHEDFRVDDWLLYATDSPWAGHARGFNRGQIFTRDGRLVASVAQEGLMRLRG